MDKMSRISFFAVNLKLEQRKTPRRLTVVVFGELWVWDMRFETTHILTIYWF